MIGVSVAALLLLFSGIPGLFLRRDSALGERLACLLVLAGAGAGLAGIVFSLTGGREHLHFPWAIPGGELLLRVDPLSALFLLPVFLVVACAAVYGLDYWPQRTHPDNGRQFRFFFGLISSALTLVLTAHNALLFLVAWEVMALAGYFLITTEGTRAEARQAGFVYLAATHTGTLALIAMFILLEQQSGSFNYPLAQSLAGGSGTAVFLLGLFGFGLKAGLMPLHIWLPGAHAAAPSHASALLSGVMIKTGIYGLVRLTSFYAGLPAWWGWTVLGLGALSGILGVAFALAQHDLKRLLAYHSVENIGIIALGLGIAFLGSSHDQPLLALLGMSGALLHMVNHGLFKSLLFLSAGAMIHATGSRDLDHYGGLFKRQPWTGLAFLVGAIAISGLPPFNGFISEWLLYLGAFHALGGSAPTLHLAVVAAPVLALIGALALACFVKVFGISFLGEPRTPAAAMAHHAPLSMRLAMLPLVGFCIWIGLLPGTIVPLLQQATFAWHPTLRTMPPHGAFAPLPWIGAAGALLLVLLTLAGVWLFFRARKTATVGSTWGCGFINSTPRIQYTASSFADTLVRLFRFGLWTEQEGGTLHAPFPTSAFLHTRTPDTVLDRLLYPCLRGIAHCCTWCRGKIQNGLIAFYLLYVALALFVLLSTSI